EPTRRRSPHGRARTRTPPRPGPAQAERGDAAVRSAGPAWPALSCPSRVLSLTWLLRGPRPSVGCRTNAAENCTARHRSADGSCTPAVGCIDDGLMNAALKLESEVHGLAGGGTVETPL